MTVANKNGHTTLAFTDGSAPTPRRNSHDTMIPNASPTNKKLNATFLNIFISPWGRAASLFQIAAITPPSAIHRRPFHVVVIHDGGIAKEPIDIFT